MVVRQRLGVLKGNAAFWEDRKTQAQLRVLAGDVGLQLWDRHEGGRRIRATVTIHIPPGWDETQAREAVVAAANNEGYVVSGEWFEDTCCSGPATFVSVEMKHRTLINAGEEN
jgi:hypothetical protein